MNLEEQRQYILAGEMYNDLTPELVQAREDAVLLTDQYNAAFGQSSYIREEILQKLSYSIGNNVGFEPTFKCEFGFNISISDNFYANFDCVMLNGGGIEIGDNVLFGPKVGIYTSIHAIDASERIAGGWYAKKVTIGNNVWVGAGVHINQGVRIGDNSVIGSGSVMTHDVPANVIAAGTSCKVIRKITEEDKTGFVDQKVRTSFSFCSYTWR